MAARTKKTDVKDEKRLSFSFFSDMDAEKKSNILKYSGVAVLVFALFTLVSVVSYLFTWQTDQSLLSHPDMMDRGVEVANWAGKSGYKWAFFLVTRCFGLGAFALIFLLGACAYRLFYWDRSIGLLRLAFLSVSGTFLASLFLAFCSDQLTSDTFFGGGLGGDAGHAVILWMNNLMGSIVSALVIFILIIAWGLMASRRFAHWFANTGERKEKEDVAEPDPVPETEEAVAEPLAEGETLIVM